VVGEGIVVGLSLCRNFNQDPVMENLGCRLICNFIAYCNMIEKEYGSMNIYLLNNYCWKRREYSGRWGGWVHKEFQFICTKLLVCGNLTLYLHIHI